MNSTDESAFDEQLRRQLDTFTPVPVPEPAGWHRLRAKLPSPPSPGPLAHLRPFAAGVVVGALLWWSGDKIYNKNIFLSPVIAVTAPPGVGYVAVTPGAAESAAAEPAAPRVAVEALPQQPKVAAFVGRASGGGGAATEVRYVVRYLTKPNIPGLPVVAATVSDSARPTRPQTATELPGPAWTRALALAVAIQQTAQAPVHPPQPETSNQQLPADTGRTEKLRRLLLAETSALAVLQQQVDSLKRALPEVPAALAVAPAVDSVAVPPRPSFADWRTLPAPRSPWAAVALLETTPSWSVLPTATPGTQNEERTLASLAQSAQIQRTVGNRWRTRVGLGLTTLRTQARYTSERTETTTHRDSTLTTTYILHQGTRIVRIVNQNTNDTTYVQVMVFDTVKTHTKVVTNRTETRRDVRQQLFRPDYQFWIVPLSVQYLLVNRNRWSLGLSLGGQLTFFRGGSRPVWTGEAYELRRVSAQQGPYRPVSLAISGGLEAQYRLTPRLSAVLAPTVRWWALQSGKGATATRSVLPAMQVGLSYGF